MSTLKSLILSTVLCAGFVAVNTSYAAKSGVDQGSPAVLIATTKGDIYIELYPEQSPISVKNFLSYVHSGFYTNTLFHRVINGFMIQGGGFTTDMMRKTPQAPIKNEADNRLRNLRGTIAMARTNVVDSATSQFFINHQDNRNLDYKGPRSFGYAVFGKVIAGMDVVDRIARVATRRGDAPVQQVIIKSVKRVPIGSIKSSAIKSSSINQG
ncbi:MAG: peptidylprolyl isomerase [Pseudomonadales bacterium]|nr:peptidylprolyl isomerase [Pseudomonadales bacterium]